MPVEIRAVAAEEFAAWVAVMLAAEHDDADPVPEAAFRRPAVDLARTLGGFDGDRVVATFRSFPTRLTVPGGEIAADAITDVGVASSHRRRGLLTAMMRRDLAAAGERGEPVAILIAAEAAIYGRYGFGCAADWGVWCLDPRRAEFSTSLAEPAEVGLEPLSAAALATVGPAVYERYRREQPGAIVRNERWWTIALDLVEQPRPVRRQQIVLARSPAGEPVGYLRYHVDMRWEDNSPAGTLVVDELLATTPAAYARLWRYCCEVDLVTEVRAPARPWPIRTRCCTTAGPGCGADRRRWPAPRAPARAPGRPGAAWSGRPTRAARHPGPGRSGPGRRWPWWDGSRPPRATRPVTRCRRRSRAHRPPRRYDRE